MITLAGNVPQTATGALADILSEIAAGTITGDLSQFGGPKIVGVFSVDNLGNGGQTLNGATLPATGYYVQQIDIGDVGDGEANSDGYNVLMPLNPQPGSSSDEGGIAPQPNLFYAAWAVAYKVSCAKGMLATIKAAPTTAKVQNIIDALNR